MNQRTPESLPRSTALAPREVPRGFDGAMPADSTGPALVVEDDPGARKYICTTLRKAGFRMLEAASGEEALDLFQRTPPRIALLDIGLPGMDGFQVCREMRHHREDLAILFLTGRGGDLDRVSALDLGADGYLVKPFGPELLVASIRAVLRRCSSLTQDILSRGDLRMELLTMKVFKAGVEVDLTPREFTLLSAFLRHPGEVMTRDQLCGQVWGEHHHGCPKALDVFLCKLREKLEDDPAHPRHFRTERGVGYVFD